MTQEEYKAKKRECWEEFLRKHEISSADGVTADAFIMAFDRAYALGREKEIISQDEIDKAAEDYVSFKKGGKCILSYIIDRACRRAFKGGANFALGKQEKDAEGEELLTCEKSKAMQLYSHLLDLVENERMSEHYSEWCDLEREYIALFGENVFADYFGSKCLTDEPSSVPSTKTDVPSSESRDCDNPLADKDGCRWRNDGKCASNNACYFEPLNPQEPKFKVGDKVRLKNVYEIDEVDEKLELVGLKGCAYMEDFDNLEPYTEPTANYVQVDYHGADTAASTIVDGCQSQPVTDCHDFDIIIKDGFREHNRLHIAAMAMQGILANSHQQMVDMKIDKVAELAIAAADKLISECEKGGEA